MARLFNDASSQYLEVAATPLTAHPLTMVAWIRCDDATLSQAIMTVGDLTATARWQLVAAGAAGGDPIQATSVIAGGTSSTSATGTGYTANTWHHVAGVFAAANSRTAYIDGVAGTTETTSRTIAGVTGITIGTRYNSGTRGTYFSGRIAQAALYNVALDPEEIAALAAGVPPLRIRPTALVGYWPLYGYASPEIDVHPRSVEAGDYSLTVTGATAANGPPKVGPLSQRLWGGMPVIEEAAAGRTTKNTRAFPLGIAVGMGHEMAGIY
jgi:hypothetical protein